MQGIVVSWLIFWSWEDLRHKSVSTRYLLLGGIILSALAFLEVVRGERTVPELVSGMLPGIVMLLASHWKRHLIGEADGLVVLFLGLLCGFWDCLNMLLCSLILFCLLAAGLLALHRIDRHTSLPFLPFVLGGYLLGGLP